MFPSSIIFVVIGIAPILLSNGYPTSPPPRELCYVPPNQYLVEATTLRVWRERDSNLDSGRLRVTRVIAGPGRLVGKEFECLAGFRRVFLSSGPGSYLLDGVVSYLEVGAEGLWWVFEDTDGRTVQPELRLEVVEAYHLQAFPYQKTKKSAMGLDERWDPRLVDVPVEKRNKVWGDARQTDVVAWRAAVVALYTAKTDDERRGILEKHASAPDSPLSAWAVSLLWRGPREPAIQFLRKLAGDDKIDPEAQIAIDRALCRLDARNWNRSDPRKVLLCRCLDAKSPGYAFTLGCRRLTEAIFSGELNATLFADALGSAMAASEKLTEVQKYALAPVLSGTRFTPGDREKVFAFLTGVVGTAKSGHVRMEAARGLYKFTPLSNRELRILGDLRALETDPAVAGYLEMAMQRQ